jgi:hypothetical protein
MGLITKETTRRLIANGRWNASRAQQGLPPDDFRPVVKLFCPWTTAVWLLSELGPDDHDRAFGLCDLGMGMPELGHVRLSSLDAIRGPSNLRIERDRGFRALKTLSAYAAEAKANRRVMA